MPFGLDKPRKGLFIAIDANIGAGNTNACHAIASAATASGLPARMLEEPTHHPKFNHFLQHYYEDLTTGKNTGGGFGMQMFMLTQRYEQHRLAVKPPGELRVRSSFSMSRDVMPPDVFVFLGRVTRGMLRTHALAGPQPGN